MYFTTKDIKIDENMEQRICAAVLKQLGEHIMNFMVFNIHKSSQALLWRTVTQNGGQILSFIDFQCCNLCISMFNLCI